MAQAFMEQIVMSQLLGVRHFNFYNISIQIQHVGLCHASGFPTTTQSSSNFEFEVWLESKTTIRDQITYFSKLDAAM